MWPWHAKSCNILKIQPFDGTHVGGNESSSSIGDGQRGPLVLLAPGFAGKEHSEDAPVGDFHVCIGHDFIMPPEVLDLAVSQVRRLDVTFESGLADVTCLLWIFELRELVGLSMNRYPFAIIPDGIARLKKLKHLHMYGSSLIKVPRSLGCLSNLEELDLYTSYGLHYLPIEVLACSKLRTSRFSTRALYKNRKGTLGIPMLPDWRTSPECGVSSTYLCAVLVRGPLLTESLVKRVFSFLSWNRCSICSQVYVHEFGCYGWSRRMVATDEQAMLAFCCSRRCLGRVPDLVRAADGVTTWAACDHLLPLTSACEIDAPFRAIPSILCQTRGTATCSMEERLVDVEAGVEIDTQEYQTIAQGDLRSAPGGKQLGRLAISISVFATRECTMPRDHRPRDSRNWLLLHRHSHDGAVAVLGWTAMTKKDGTPKLRTLGPRG